MSDTLPRMNAAEAAYRAIRAQIVSGELAEGERLTEKRLSKDLGLSRTPIREAIGRLILEGFVERQTGYTTRVAHFPEDEIAQIFEIRCILEAYSARRAAKHATPEDIAELRLVHADMQKHTPPRSDDDYKVLTEANEKFHRIILRAAQSPRLTALMTMAFDVGMVVRTYRIYSDADLLRSLHHHAELIDAIEANAPDWAENVMGAHLLAGAAKVSDHVQAPAEAQVSDPVRAAE
ncbi:MAG: GntR family transcriptional regulator [Dinoroseobacter sp.]|nr:GntR family transcriptional regulator [Dinoroseobacter sp.]